MSYDGECPECGLHVGYEQQGHDNLCPFAGLDYEQIQEYVL